MSARVVHRGEAGHRCDLTGLAHHDWPSGTVARCDECGTFHRWVVCDRGAYWRRCAFQRLVARKYGEVTMT